MEKCPISKTHGIICNMPEFPKKTAFHIEKVAFVTHFMSMKIAIFWKLMGNNLVNGQSAIWRSWNLGNSHEPCCLPPVQNSHPRQATSALNNTTHYVKFRKKRRKSSKRNYYIISPRVTTNAIIIHTLARPPHPRPPTPMNKLRIHERICTTCSECVRNLCTLMSKHLCNAHTCVCTDAQRHLC